ncbi:Mesaconyl-C(4)-CoA hydratase [Vanrija pseudolonga]|uniref:Mesaconyl-C(4)-CoA hydratase n=1 Tax=Vanrija pseudolonga TaxID=143232 RepID=A0AAF0YFI2_9TREE|nr:Mesaconyl-C(4)-CoA hydratase [Vanrija pseudolonga]
MLRLAPRLASTRLAVPPRAARPLFTGTGIKSWIEDLTTQPAELSTDTIDNLRATRLVQTLPTRENLIGGTNVEEGGPLPKAHHLVYFNPDAWLGQLGADGTNTEYNAPNPYTRRMWAGGRFLWNPKKHLRIGTQVTQSVRVDSAVEKNNMVFVEQAREFYADKGDVEARDWAVREERTHVFLPELSGAKGGEKKKPSAADLPKPVYEHAFVPDSPLLFRYSALTWNAHKIHYDLDWTREVEGHPDLVFHGPLTATLLVELAQRAADDVAAEFVKFEYRATHPMYVKREIKLRAAWIGPRGTKLQVWAEQDGVLCMKGTAEFVPV